MPALDLASVGELTFEEPGPGRLPVPAPGARGRGGGRDRARVLNAADEVAVEAFLAGAIPFTAIPEVIEATLDAMPRHPAGALRGPLSRPTPRRASARHGSSTRRTEQSRHELGPRLRRVHRCWSSSTRLGHFLAAKAVGMQVEKFFLFFPPKLFSVKRGETEYGIGAIPARRLREDHRDEPRRGAAARGRHRGYYAMPVWKRIFVIAAGPAVNIVVAFLILFGAGASPTRSRRRSGRQHRPPTRPPRRSSRTATRSSPSTASPAATRSSPSARPNCRPSRGPHLRGGRGGRLQGLDAGRGRRDPRRPGEHARDHPVLRR